MFSNHFTTNFSQNAPVKIIVKIGQYLAKIWTKLCGLLFGGHPVQSAVWQYGRGRLF